MESNELKLFMQAMRTDNPWVEINNQMIQMIAAGFTRGRGFRVGEAADYTGGEWRTLICTV